MDGDDLWSAELEALVLYGSRMDWEDRCVYTYASSGKFEMMDDEKLELPMDPYYEFKPIKDAEHAKACEEEYKAHFEAYGPDCEMMDLMCHESAIELHQTLWRSERGVQLHSKIREMDELYSEERYDEAHALGQWLLEQDGQFGVGYNKKLFLILKRTVANIAFDKSRQSGGFISLSGIIL